MAPATMGAVWVMESATSATAVVVGTSNTALLAGVASAVVEETVMAPMSGMLLRTRESMATCTARADDDPTASGPV